MVNPIPKQTLVEPARIEKLSVRNYRALRDVSLGSLGKPLTPLTVFVGPNGSGKSTVFDVFAFLAECFSAGLRKAWDKRGRFKELRSRQSDGPIAIELKYRESGYPLIAYHLEVDEDDNGPFVSREWLRWTRKKRGAGRPFTFLDFSGGIGMAVPGEDPVEIDPRREHELESRELLAINALGQFKDHPRVSALRRFITGWYLSYLSADGARGLPEAGPQERLSESGDNLPNVIQYLSEQHPKRLDAILRALAARVPRLQRVEIDPLRDGRLLLLMKDAPFQEPILSKWVSDGTLKMLQYLVVLNDPEPASLVGVEEPENHIHPRLLESLAEECRSATAGSQLLVTTHSPFFLNGLRTEEAWVLYRDQRGYTRARRATDDAIVAQMMQNGAKLGDLWIEGYLGAGDPFELTAPRAL